MLKTLLKSVRQYKRDSLLTSFFVILVVAIEGIIPFVLAKLVNSIQEGVSLDIIVENGVILTFFAVISLIFGIISGKKGAVASAGFAKNLRNDVFKKIQDFSFENMNEFSNSSLLTRLTTDIANVQNAYLMIIRIAIRMPLMFIFSFIMAFIIAGKLALIFVVVVPVLLIGLGLIIFSARKIFVRVFKKYDILNRTIQENIKALRLVKALVRKDYEIKKFDDIAVDVKNDFTRAEKVLAFNAPLLQFCLYLDTILILTLGSFFIVNKIDTSFNVGQISALLTYSYMILFSLMMFSMILVMLTMAIESARRIVEVLETKPSIVNSGNNIHKIERGFIEFKNVNFKYSKDAKENVLSDISFKIPQGSNVGIIGATGSGKSTLVQLIPRLYDIQSGEILIDDINIKDIDLVHLRDMVAMVLQKNTLFFGTVAENLRWGNKDASIEQLDEVCKIAQAKEIVDKLPNGYETIIEQGGANLSGGQKQRLCIARALLKKPKILIFDDSTSAVDTKTDELIRRGLESYMKESTKIIISQRILSVQNSDIIFVLEKGKIVAQGNHTDLINQEGLYRQLYLTQQGGAVDEN